MKDVGRVARLGRPNIQTIGRDGRFVVCLNTDTMMRRKDVHKSLAVAAAAINYARAIMRRRRGKALGRRLLRGGGG